MSIKASMWLEPIGYIRSTLRDKFVAPRQGNEGAPDAWVELNSRYMQALDGVAVGDEIILITWFHLADRDVQKVYPRGDTRNPLLGVFATRSPDRPNPLGLHPVRVLEMTGSRLKVGPLEAIDGTPVVDIKPVI
jgi:tRNA-Thr(GGU) m(6)t(6)A37 methyltransferase TsaA